LAGFILRLDVTKSSKQHRAELRPEDVFDAIWLVVGNRASISAQEERRMRLFVAKLLVELESSGVTDPRELRRRAVEEILLAAPQRDADLHPR